MNAVGAMLDIYVSDAVSVMEKMVGFDQKDYEATLKASKCDGENVMII